MDKCLYRSGVGNESRFGRAVIVRMGRQIRQTRPDKIAYPAHFPVIQRSIESRDDHIRRFFFQNDARLRKFLPQQRVAEQKNLLPGKIFLQTEDRRLSRCDDFFRPGLPSHPAQFFHICLRIFGRIVRQKYISAARFLNFFKELPCAVYPLFAKINRAVHIQRETADFFQNMFFVLIGFRNFFRC